MIETVFHSADLDATDRFAAWCDDVCAYHAPYALSSPHTADFAASLGLLRLGPVTVSVVATPSLHAQRSPRLIRASDPEAYVVTLVRRGTLCVTRAGTETEVRAGQLMVSDTSRPLRSSLAAHAGRAELVHVVVPHALLPVPADVVERAGATPVSGDQGVGALLSRSLARLVTDPVPYGPAAAACLGHAAIELSAAALLAHQQTGDVPHPERLPQALSTRVHAYIQDHLGDVDLTPTRIAEAHHISIRSLYRLFESQGTSLAELIRELRLDGARRDLADPLHGGQPIGAIAARWGFRRAGDFTRAFRAAYGVPPGDYRRRAGRGTTGRLCTEVGTECALPGVPAPADSSRTGHGDSRLVR
ncbi:helix-turn-helix domain-containing protein [Streptomyces venezuelae]|uniref:helix-turn-helix domain-containing protein n=1 Tax=Streptomyces venezuelae TaxID=54571 RepID=UPI0037883C4B